MNWISVKDRLPEEFENVLTSIKVLRIDPERGRILAVDYDMCVSHFKENEGNIPWKYANIYRSNTESLDNFVFLVTHWMPLPELPEDE